MRIAVLYGFLLSLIALLDIFIFVTCGLLGMLVFHKSYCTLLVPGYKATIELEQNNIDEFTVFFFCLQTNVKILVSTKNFENAI